MTEPRHSRPIARAAGAAALAMLIAGTATAADRRSPDAEDAAAPTAAALGPGDAEAGRTVFNTCRACHGLSPGDHGIGPSLHALFGRRVGTARGYALYSNALARADFVWTAERLDAWLTRPNSFLPGNRMNFAGLRDADDRADLIAFLKTASE
ncbi:c-type cytochrome [Rhodothalassium salexigens]|uniref:c-type cytochrome n=1 Tax=Rhodothalassium salexigens TaxID=1086 RepID=UPI0019135EB2|nr:cytochrome c family protein [Rhodothalassium salexigens]